MKIGIMIPNGTHLQAEDVIRLARSIEEIGFDAIWVPEHLAVPGRWDSSYPYTTSGRATFSPQSPWLEAFTMLGFCAAATESVRLGTAVTTAWSRNPIFLAKQATTLDVLSEGRLDLGLGAGWLREEAALLGQATSNRHTRLAETVQALVALWSDRDLASFEGKVVSFPPVGSKPSPVQRPGPPIWIGGHETSALEITASHHVTGWIAWRLYGAELARRMHRVRNLRQSRYTRVAVCHTLDIGGSGEGPCTGSVSDVIRGCAELIECGIDQLILARFGTRANVLSQLEQFAERVLPELPLSRTSAGEKSDK